MARSNSRLASVNIRGSVIAPLVFAMLLNSSPGNASSRGYFTNLTDAGVAICDGYNFCDYDSVFEIAGAGSYFSILECSNASHPSLAQFSYCAAPSAIAAGSYPPPWTIGERHTVVYAWTCPPPLKNVYGQCVGPTDLADPCQLPVPVPKDGNPINSLTGNKFEIETDIPDQGTGLSLVRTYNSMDAALTPMGYGWRHNWSQRVTFTGLKSNYTAIATVQRPDGNAFMYWFDPMLNAWQPSTRYTKGVLSETVDGSGMTTGWTFRKPDGTIEQFRANGTLSALIKPNGETYSVTDVQGQVGIVTAPSSATLVFGYTNGRINSVRQCKYIKVSIYVFTDGLIT